VRGEGGAVVCSLCSGADAVASAVQPDHDGEMGAGLGARGEDVEVKAVFGGGEGFGDVVDAVSSSQGLEKVVGAVDVLGAGVGGLGGIANSLPRGGGLGSAPAQRADGRSGEGNAFEDGNVLLRSSLEGAGGDAGDGARGRRLLRSCGRG